ncbi:uncharacterized protein LOC118800811 [Colossoma macropomum]|uniref:uncharacterized protein LOC118800811 n=1 Tax=Colossoma macropomum TaxID=42526 RepID=UPI001864839F|nr:uncharacterized protein LOC118800811 [Colossoma macropomum]
MQSWSSAFCVLILLITTLTTVSGAAPTEIKVKLNDSATLPCNDRCSGLVTWFQKSGIVVAQCNQTSCLSVKDGFEMFYDQYLKGNNSLIIPEADTSKISEYTCQCDLKTISAVQLHVDAVPSVKADLHGNATLYCSVDCSGLATWFRTRYPSDVVAQCDQTSCQSVKAGYQMIYAQYLKGNLSLYITDADFSMRGLYTCECDGTVIRDVEFSINALNSTLQIKSGESLVLDLEIPDPVEVLHDSTGADGFSSGQICTVNGRSVQCSDDYKQRVLFSPALEVKGMNLSHSGVYTIRDARTKEDIHVYTVTVRDDPDPPGEQKIVSSVLKLAGIVVGTAVITIVIWSVIVGICMKKTRLCGGCFKIDNVAGNEEDNQDAEKENILTPYQQ